MSRQLKSGNAPHALIMLCLVSLITVLFSIESAAEPTTTGTHSNRLRKVKSTATLTAGLLTPSTLTSAAGKAQTLCASYIDPDGYINISMADLLIGHDSGVNALWVSYDRGANKLYLYNDSGKSLTGGCIPGQAGTISNTQGTVDCRQTTVIVAGSNMTVNWRIIPKPAFTAATAKKMWLILRDNYNRNSGWTMKGTWLVTK